MEELRKDTENSVLFTRLEYYKFAREEIQREDNITHQRLTSSLTFQGFLVASVAIVVGRAPVGPNQTGSMVDLHYTILIVLLGVGFFGAVLAWFSYRGVKASRISLNDAREEWKAKNKLWHIHPDFAPQLTGRKGLGEDEQETDARLSTSRSGLFTRFDPYEAGSSFSLAVPGLFIFMWVAFLVYISILMAMKVGIVDVAWSFLAGLVSDLCQTAPSAPPSSSPRP